LWESTYDLTIILVKISINKKKAATFLGHREDHAGVFKKVLGVTMNTGEQQMTKF
jgi:hypothetical protein